MANIQRYGGMLDDFFSDFNKGFWVKPYAMPGEPELRMKLDIKETDKAYTVHADIPGVSKDEIQVDLNGDQVSIRAEVKREKEKKDGVLELTLPKKAGAQARRLAIH